MQLPSGDKFRARRLRRQATPAEKAFWELVRDRRLSGLKFRRQVPFGSYVVDFFCHEAKLVVELDGGVHVLRQAEDAERDAWITESGYTVLRFSNQMVFDRPHVIMAAIKDAAARSRKV